MANLIFSRASRPSGGKLARRLLAPSLLLVLSVAIAASSAHAQCTMSSPTSWIDANSNWNSASHWSTGAVPNSSGTNVCITNGTNITPVTVTLDISASVANLQLGSFDTLSTDLGTQLSVFGTQILNAGQLVLNGGGGANTFLLLDANTKLQGGGTVTMNVAGGGGSTFIQQGVGGVTLTNADNTIQGTGILGNGGLALSNAGIVNANSSGLGLLLNGSGGITNTNLLEATNGGVLQISGSTVNNTGGNITANGGTVQLINSAVIQGGTLNQVSGTLGTPVSNVATLDGSTGAGAVTLSSGSTYTGDLGSETFVLGTINNKGNFQLNGGGGTNAILLLNANTMLQGGGTVTMNVAGGGGTAFIEQAVGGVTLTNADNTIQGTGILGNGGLALSNAGIVNANSSGLGLLLNGSGGITNTNLLEATNGGVLQISGSTVNNTGGNITANGGTVQLINSAVVQGGTLNTLGGGTLGTSGGNGATLDGSSGAGAVTINGTYTSDFNSQTTVLGTINNKGNIQLNAGGGTNSFLLMGGGAGSNQAVTLQGGGTVTLSATTTGGGGNAFLEQSIGGVTLTNVNNTIQGEGVIGNNGLTLVNQATINANSTGGPLITTLTLNSANVTNTGLLEATNSGILQISAITVNNAGGNITANGGTVQLINSAVIQGGTLNQVSGTLGTPVSNVATLDGSTGAGAVTLSSGSTYTGDLGSETFVLGTINNKGNFQLNGGGGTNTILLLNANTTLQGGGTVTMNVAGGGGTTFIEQAVGGVTLTNADNTIQGTGVIGNGGLALSNAGIVNANSSGLGLLLNGSGGITNTNLLEATNGGVLQISGSTVNNTGGNITANGGTVQLFGSALIQGGTLNQVSGTLGTPNGNVATLDGSSVAGAITINGTYTSDFNTDTTLLGTINNKGNIQLNGGAGTNSILLMGGGAGSNTAVTLQGGGTVTLSTTTTGGGGSAFLEQSIGGVTLTNVNNTIQGEGIIGNNGLTLLNQSGGTINANSTGSPLTSMLTFQSANVANQGLMEATNSGVLQFNGVTVNNAGGNITANGASATVQFFGSAVIQGGTLTNHGGTLGTPANNVATLDGTTQGALTINGTYLSDLNTQTTLLGTINNNNNLQLNGGAGTNSILFAGNNVTLQGGGTVTLSTTTTGGGGQAFIEQSAGGLTLTNVNNTIQGEGIIGNNGLTLLNQSGGTVNANSAGSPLISTLTFQSANVTNQGLMEATNSGVLQFNGVTVNNAGGNITANGASATVQFFGSAVIQGGTLTNHGGTLGTPANNVATLDGSSGAGAVTINGTYTSDLNTQTTLLGTINNNNNFQLNGGAGTNSFLFAGNNVTLQGGGTVTLSTAGGGGSAFIEQLVGGLTLENVNNTIQGAGVIGNNGLSVLNDAGGTLLANAAGQTLSLSSSGTLTNNGTMEAAAGGTMQVTMPLANFSGNTLAGGTYIVDGTSAASTMNLSLGANTGGEIVNNAANIILNGTNANVSFIDANGNQLLSALAANATAGSGLTIENGYNLTTPGDFSNAGTMTVGSGSTFKMGAGGTNGYTQSSGTTQGIGTIAGNVTLNGGTILPGLLNAPGTLSITGSYNQNAGNFGEQMLNASTFGVLNVTGGNVTLGAGADLNITLLKGFNPVGNMYTILTDTGGLVSGTFANAPASGFQMDGVNWTVAYNSNNVILDAVSLVGSLITATWNTPTGNWTTASKWSCTPGPANCVPNNNASNVYAAILNSPGQTLTLDIASSPSSIAINTLAVTAGTLDVASGASLNSNSYTQSGGGTKIELSGTISAPTFTVTGGSVQGTGTIAGAVSMGGTIIAGFGPSTPGMLNINGGYHQTSGGVYSELISGTANGLLNVSGDTLLDAGASLTITLLGGFNPVNGTQYTILDYGGTENGTFTITDPTFNGGTQQWVITYHSGGDGDDIILTAEPVNTAPTPEPGSLLLLGTGLLGVSGLLRRKRSAKTH